MSLPEHIRNLEAAIRETESGVWTAQSIMYGTAHPSIMEKSFCGTDAIQRAADGLKNIRASLRDMKRFLDGPR